MIKKSFYHMPFSVVDGVQDFTDFQPVQPMRQQFWNVIVSLTNPLLLTFINFIPI